MRIKEISTLVGAGILSLAAVMILETGGTSHPDPALLDAADFEDTSSLIEYSYPVPTAEPPAKETASVNDAAIEEGGADAPEPVDTDPAIAATEAAAAVKEALFESVGGADPVPVATDTDGNPVVAGLTEPVENGEPANDSPVALPDDSGPAPAGTATTTTAEGGLSETFMKAVAAATDTEGDAGTTTSTATNTAAADAGEQPSIIEETPDGFWLKSAKLNDVFQHLAQLADMQYFHNVEIDAPNFVVTGQLMDDDPIKQMEELALMYGITIHQKGNTVYALNSAQLSQLPTEPFRYQLKYLRPKDIEQIKLILQPFLTPGSGIIEYETKTNTLIVMDNTRKLDALAVFLDQIDQPKQQIAIETRILRVSSSSRNRIGVDWNSVLGEGLEFSGASSLNALFNLPELDTVTQVLTATGAGGSLGVVRNNLDNGVENSVLKIRVHMP